MFNYDYYKELEIVNIFEFYDHPLFYIAKSKNEDFYMFYFIDDNNTISEWFVSQITKNEIQRILNKQTGILSFLKKLLKKRRLNRLVIDIHNSEEPKLVLTRLDKLSINYEEFPEDDFKPEYDYLNDTELVHVPDISMPDVNNFKVVLKDDNNSHNIDANFLINTLQHVTASITALSEDYSKEMFGVSNSINDSINLDVVAFQASSFAICFEIKEDDKNDMFELSNRSVELLFDTINSINSKTEKDLYDEFYIEEKYSVKSLKKINDFLNDVKDNDYSLSVEAPEVSEAPEQSKDSYKYKVEFDEKNYSNLKHIENILNKSNSETMEEIVLEGTLISVNTKRNSFWLSVDNEPDISGTFEKELFEKIKHAGEHSVKVPSRIKVILNKTTIVKHLTNEYSVKYVLISFEYIDNESHEG